MGLGCGYLRGCCVVANGHIGRSPVATDGFG
jgi:hypothetical protein